MIYADFDYPEDIEHLIRFMPATPEQAVGSSSIESAWQAYLERRRSEYSARRSE
jgi:hypothetical protein